MLLYLGTSWSTVSLGSIQTVESLHTKSSSNLGSSTATGEKGEFCHFRRSSRLTLCPLMPGSPAVPGIPRAPCKERRRGRASGLVFSLTEKAEEQSLTEVPGSPRSPGRPDLPGSPYFRDRPRQITSGWQQTSITPGKVKESIYPVSVLLISRGGDQWVSYIISVLSRGASRTARTHGTLENQNDLLALSEMCVNDLIQQEMGQRVKEVHSCLRKYTVCRG